MIFGKNNHTNNQLKQLKSLINIKVLTIFSCALLISLGSLILLSKKNTNHITKISNIGVSAKPVNEKTVTNIQKTDQKVKYTTVRKGDNFATVLKRLNVNKIDTYNAIKALSASVKNAKLKVRNKVYVYYNDQNIANSTAPLIDKIKIYVSDTKRYEIAQNKNGDFIAKEVNIELFSRLQVKSGKIKTSLYQDAIDAGIPPAIIMEFIRFYSFDLDFQRDIRKGDKFQIFYETFYNNEGEFIKNGDIIFCKFINGNTVLSNYKYTTTKGSTLYFNEKGSSVKKALLKTPISGARISSRFGYRKHPILGYTKLHSGVDFAARRGTPIYAAGNGTVSYIGWYKGYGKYIKIRHNSQYSTAYGHMSRFYRGLKRNSKVRQGQVIGYVGSTGRSTGPHLHYEVHSRNKAINPRRLKPQSKVTLKGKELNKFYAHRDRINFILNNAFAEAKID